jgi:hypothetical protein
MISSPSALGELRFTNDDGPGIAKFAHDRRGFLWTETDRERAACPRFGAGHCAEILDCQWHTMQPSERLATSASLVRSVGLLAGGRGSKLRESVKLGLKLFDALQMVIDQLG